MPHAAPPPTRAEVQRRLSTRSKSQAPPPAAPVTSGNESDSSVASSSMPTTTPLSASHFATSPLTSPGIGPHPHPPGLSAIDETQGSSMGEDKDGDLEDVDDSDDDVALSKADVEGQRVHKSGWLIKKQERRKMGAAWKKKWFVLRTTSLAYYKDNKEYSLSRSIELTAVHSVVPVTQEKAKHPFSFAVVTADRTFFLEASSAEEREDWVSTINSVRKQGSEREEEKSRRAKSVAVPVPGRSQQPEPEVETHQGTWTSTFSATTTASVSPTAGSYFHRNAPSQSTFAQPPPIGHQPRAHSPSSNPNTLSSQMASMSVTRSPSQKAPPPSAMPPSVASINRRLSNPIIHPPPNLQSIQTPVRPQRRDFTAVESAAPGALGPPQSTPQFVSSDEEDAYFSDPTQWSDSQQPPMAVSDPNKIIIATYLMKKSRKTAREVWRKRWFYLTSAGMTYSKSHMDVRPLNFVPINTILDVFSVEDTDDDDLEDSSDDSRPAQPTRGASLRKQREATVQASHSGQPVIRIVTNKRRFDLCAPSEEEEIKWIAAIRALVNRDREKRQPGTITASMPSRPEGAPALGAPAPLTIPTIAQQPPTPGSNPSVSPSNVTPPKGFNEHGQRTFSPTHGRSRSATQTAKNAVADVVRRFHEGGQ
ncbi:PH-domain-containing protein [Cutaneotrichosporon oleaginosum]|uniref:PH-domain-containing protein n=1 Tax=Cutaneotrichosporon oleaginosum TaxID=879819 RepID=A0A0J0XWU6_9TREE|nr:PH-domain-containing protein [Cutaneotrichosporon oleaginosum]KLT45537.1 PH-domain-containing protein [Cutaneotrichosporon oleaginosum]TXT14509.1 hypothetical protein COLE_00702 [Cutaneotrichosporon oleaginosum]